MLIDMRIDTFHPGMLPVFLQRFEQQGLPIQLRHCGNLIGYFTTVSMVLNVAHTPASAQSGVAALSPLPM